MQTVNYNNFDWKIVKVETAETLPNLREHWSKHGIVEMLIVTGQPKRKVFTFCLYRQVDGTLRKVL